jgi:hypothetical protein
MVTPHFFKKIGVKVKISGFISFVINKISRHLYAITQVNLKNSSLRNN